MRKQSIPGFGKGRSGSGRGDKVIIFFSPPQGTMANLFCSYPCQPLTLHTAASWWTYRHWSARSWPLRPLWKANPTPNWPGYERWRQSLKGVCQWVEVVVTGRMSLFCITWWKWMNLTTTDCLTFFNLAVSCVIIIKLLLHVYTCMYMHVFFHVFFHLHKAHT